MKIIIKTGLFLIFNVHLLIAQNVTTIIQNGSGIDEALLRSKSGELYGTGYLDGTLNTFSIGSTTQILNFLASPSEMVELSNGMIAVAESQGNRIVLFDPQNQTQQVLTDVIPNPAGIIKMPTSDTLLVSSTSTNKIYSVSPNGDTNLYLSSNLLNTPVSMIWDDNNNLFIANYSSGMIVKRVSYDSIISFCTLPTSSLGHIIKVENSIYATGVFSNKIYEIDIETSAWKVFAGSDQGSVNGDIGIAQFNSPNGITASVTGDSLYISEYNTQAIRLISGISGTTGLNGQDHESSLNPIKIWPNPLKLDFHMQLTTKNESFKVQLYDITGLLIDNNLKSHRISEDIFHFSLSNKVSDGLYMLQYTSNSCRYTQKIIIRND